ncbi:hypothetical protein DEO72_LG10g1197 [Vigna unguiculata]|uniref:Uncharacterized protein n=1 Tax=Vigna unguiculata TaxID=3917 RepID=A0A4D6NB22_VIGUN|nr:hypothetical protein DEO72_LG10g1197 [Vigna unguiculata]
MGVSVLTGKDSGASRRFKQFLAAYEDLGVLLLEWVHSLKMDLLDQMGKFIWEKGIMQRELRSKLLRFCSEEGSPWMRRLIPLRLISRTLKQRLRFSMPQLLK